MLSARRKLYETSTTLSMRASSLSCRTMSNHVVDWRVECACDYGMLRRIGSLWPGTERRKDTRLKTGGSSSWELLVKKKYSVDAVRQSNNEAETGRASDCGSRQGGSPTVAHLRSLIPVAKWRGRRRTRMVTFIVVRRNSFRNVLVVKIERPECQKHVVSPKVSRDEKKVVVQNVMIKYIFVAKRGYKE